MGGVVNVVTKSGTQSAARLGLRLFRVRAQLEADYKTVQTVNGTVNTVEPAGIGPRHRSRRPHRPRSSCSSSARSTRRGRTRTFIAPDDIENFPLRAWAKSIAIGGPCRTRPRAPGSRPTRIASTSSFFGDPSKGEMGPQRTSSLTVHGHLVVQRARIRRPQPDRPLRRRLRHEDAGRGVVRARLQQDLRDCRRLMRGA